MKEQLIRFLEACITDERREQMTTVLNKRTRYLTLVLEDIFQPQNASAVLRTADCFGIQDVHIIENKNEFNVNPKVVMGASKWIDVHKYNKEENNTLSCIHQLRAKGYRIIATTPHENDTDLHNFDLTKGPAALVFGTELTGISQTVIDQADGYLKIPMQGYTESLNISVAAAIISHYLTLQLRQSDIDWKLPHDQMQDTYIQWLKKTIRRSDKLVKEFYDRHG